MLHFFFISVTIISFSKPSWFCKFSSQFPIPLCLKIKLLFIYRCPFTVIVKQIPTHISAEPLHCLKPSWNTQDVNAAYYSAKPSGTGIITYITLILQTASWTTGRSSVSSLCSKLGAQIRYWDFQNKHHRYKAIQLLLDKSSEHERQEPETDSQPVSFQRRHFCFRFCGPAAWELRHYNLTFTSLLWFIIFF